MIVLCGSPTPSGFSCGYPPNQCPLHIRDLTASDTAPAAEEPEPGEVDTAMLAKFAASVVVRLSRGKLSPLDAMRALRALATFTKLPGPPEDEDEILAEVELRGVVMNGFPPRNEEEWQLARKVFDADAIEEFERWEREGKGW